MIPRFIFTFLLISFINNICNGQNLVSKDGLVLGKKSDFFNACVKGVKNEFVKINDIEVNSENYCTCLMDNFIPNINSKYLIQAVNDNKLNELILQDEYFHFFSDCIDNNIKINDKYRFENQDEIVTELSIKNCVNEILNDTSLIYIFTPQLAKKYCECSIEKLYNSNYSFKDLKDIENLNSITYNELIVECFNEILKNNSNFSFSNNYSINDIIGDKDSSVIKLIDYLGKGYMLKLSIGNISKYYLFDTGSSDLLINKEMESILIENGSLKKENYLEEIKLKLANNQIVTGRKVKVDKIIIGDYQVNNIIITIIEEGTLICGRSFLDKFKKWEIDNDKKILILYK